MLEILLIDFIVHKRQLHMLHILQNSQRILTIFSSHSIHLYLQIQMVMTSSSSNMQTKSCSCFPFLVFSFVPIIQSYASSLTSRKLLHEHNRQLSGVKVYIHLIVWFGMMEIVGELRNRVKSFQLIFLCNL